MSFLDLVGFLGMDGPRPGLSKRMFSKLFFCKEEMGHFPKEFSMITSTLSKSKKKVAKQIVKK